MDEQFEQSGVVETTEDLNYSVILTKNPGCKITSPDGTPLDLSASQVIPKGTLIVGECFASRNQ